MKVIIATLGMLVSFATSGFELKPDCHKLYEMFKLHNLSYEDVGKITDKKHENVCWPVLQGVKVTPLSNAKPTEPVTAATTCDGLAKLITNASDTIGRMYGVKPLDQATCTKRLAFFKNERGYLNFYGRYVPEEKIFGA